MADPEQVERLRRSVDEWNFWRLQQPYILPDLSGVSLRFAKLNGAQLGGAYLSRTDLSGANLEGAILRRAVLGHANLSYTILKGADLRGAFLHSADLRGADLTEAIFGYTTFAWVDLSHIFKGLETVTHDSPSAVDINSILLPTDKHTCDHFLRGVGLSDTLITYLSSPVTTATHYQSCFIRYSNKDDLIARKLYDDLQKNGVRCWFAPHDLKWGERIRTGINEAIDHHERVLLILSKHALASGWVEQEVKRALSREYRQTDTVLFPVRVDEAILESPLAWATEIRRERNVGDFSRWKNDTAYQEAFNRLLRDIKVNRPPTR